MLHVHCNSSEPYPADTIMEVICCCEDLKVHGCLGSEEKITMSGLAGAMISYKISGLGLCIQSIPHQQKATQRGFGFAFKRYLAFMGSHI